MQITIYEHRLDFVRRYVVDKDVLDVGTAELVGTVNKAKLSRWSHKVIRDLAKSVIGLEKNGKQVKALTDMGFHVIEGDAEDFDLGTTFDVVFAGELIEHLANVGLFLRCVRRHLRPSGVLLITTPNRYSIIDLWHIVRRNEVRWYTKPIDSHVAYYDISSLLELLSRERFEVIEIGYYIWVGAPSASKLVRKALSLLKRFRCHLLPGIVVAARCCS